MNRNVIMRVVLVAGALAGSGVGLTAEAPPKKVRPGDAPRSMDTEPVPSAGSVEAKARPLEPLKWDQLDSKAVERFAKKGERKSPFAAVPPER